MGEFQRLQGPRERDGESDRDDRPSLGLLAPSIFLLEEFLESTTDPYYAGAFGYGRPMKGHGWQPWSNADLMGTMAEHIAARAPAGADVSWRR
jgi:hypothetical protein